MGSSVNRRLSGNPRCPGSHTLRLCLPQFEAAQTVKPDATSVLLGKAPAAGRDWGQEEKGTTEEEMAGGHHRLDGHEFEQTLEMVRDREAWSAAVHGVAKVRHDRATE